MTPETETWTDMLEHELLTKRTQKPLIETRVSKVMKASIDEVFAHFFGSQPELRLDLHKDHVKAYHIHNETPDTLEYEYVFEAYGARNWGKAVEVADRPHRIDVEVKAGPLTGQTVTTLFEEVEGGTKVTQVNRVWPGDADMTVKLMGKKLTGQLAALAGVHLEQHRCDIEGEERFQDRFSKEHQHKLESESKSSVADFLGTTRAITLPIILLPILAGALLADAQATFSWVSLALTMLGGGAALLGANLLNDLYDFKGGADVSARSIPGQIETGSGAFVEGRWSLKKGWAMTAVLFGIAAAAGAWLAVTVSMQVIGWALLGGLIGYIYIGPPFPLAYKGRGLGELAIFAAFGLAPVVGATLAHGGQLTRSVWWVAACFGMTASIVLFHHHFLHWQADRAAGKGSPVAVLGPSRGALAGLLLGAATSLVFAGAVNAGALPMWALIACVLPPLVLWPTQLRLARGDVEAPARQRMAGMGFLTMLVCNIALLLAIGL